MRHPQRFELRLVHELLRILNDEFPYDLGIGTVVQIGRYQVLDGIADAQIKQHGFLAQQFKAIHGVFFRGPQQIANHRLYVVNLAAVHEPEHLEQHPVLDVLDVHHVFLLLYHVAFEHGLEYRAPDGQDVLVQVQLTFVGRDHREVAVLLVNQDPLEVVQHLGPRATPLIRISDPVNRDSALDRNLGDPLVSKLGDRALLQEVVEAPGPQTRGSLEQATRHLTLDHELVVLYQKRKLARRLDLEDA